MNLKFYPLWAINAPLDENKLCRQLDEMKNYGFDGAVFHPRFYPNDPPYLGDKYLEILSNTILYAKKIGLEFWIYDENGYPSGTVGGKTLELYPELANTWLDLTKDKSLDSISEFQYDGETWYLEKRIGHGVDYFNPKLAEKFLELTYERYAKGLQAEAFEYITTFFCDEPEFGLGHAYDSLSPNGAIPWTENLPELFEQKYGENLIEKLPQLFFPIENYQETRIKFREFLTDLFIESFIKKLNDWCKLYGKTFTAHVKGEEHPLFQTAMNGSCHQVFQHIGLPGIDALERFPTGNFFPRQVASVAQQFGNGNSMVECFGGAGWGATPADFENYLLWLSGHGINHFAVHLYQYELTTHAMHDWGPSIPNHLNWREGFPEILKKVKNSVKDLPPADLLIVAPYRGIAAEYEPKEILETNIHNAAFYPETIAGTLNTNFLELVNQIQESGANYHVCDERTFVNGKLENGRWKIGNCEYSKVILAEGTGLNSDLGIGIADLIDSSIIKNSETLQLRNSETQNIDWQVQTNINNDFVLEVESLGNLQFSANFESAENLKVELFFLDEVSEVFINSKPYENEFECLKDANEIRFKCAEKRVIPFLSVRGKFVVKSLSPFEKSANATIKTLGKFVLQNRKKINVSNLITSGYPFCRETVKVNGIFDSEQGFTKLKLKNISTDCVRIAIDGIDCGWCWGADWTVNLPQNLSIGKHTIEVELIPSTFNFFGPHHHIDGDLKVVSPVQFDYVKNFADRSDAPENTRIKEWNFKPFGIGTEIEISN